MATNTDIAAGMSGQTISVPASGMPMGDPKQDLVRSIRRHLWGAGLFLLILLGFIIFWSASMTISGAVIAPGSVVVETNVKTVKHREGGIVSDILVRDGDKIAAGDLLLRLDDVTVRANLAVVTSQLHDLLARQGRLMAERDDLETIAFPEILRKLSMASQEGSLESVAELLDSQTQLMNSRKAALASRIEQLQGQIGQLQSQLEGLQVQVRAKRGEIELIDLGLPGLESLFEKNLIPASQIYSERRQKVRLDGELGVLLAQIAQAGIAQSERRILILQLQEENQASILQEMQQVTVDIARLQEQRIALEDQLARMEIRAPRAGVVHQLAVHTRGGVISPAEPIMLIVPETDALLLEVQVAPTDIDQLHVGQQATIRLPGFNQRTTPELQAAIHTISAETSRDEITGAAYYTARLGLLEGEMEKLKGLELLPGMPVEALVQTQDRTILSYLTKPLTDQITRALREE